MNQNNDRSRPRKPASHRAAPGQRGYVPPSSNPYLSSVESGRVPEFDVIKPEDVQTNRVINPDPVLMEGKRPSGERRTQTRRPSAPPRKGGPAKKSRAILFTILGIVAAGLVIFYFVRPVTVMVNGKRLTFTVNTTADQVLSSVQGSKDISIKPGNLISVNENVLKEGGGYPYTLAVNGDTLSYEQAQEYHVHANDDLVFSNGENKMEEYTSQEERIEPVMTKNGAYGSVAYISQWGKAGIKEIKTGKISGEVSKGEMKEPVQDVIVTYLNVTPKNGEKLVALTFDDGPSNYTDQILAILKKEDVKATFFMLGENAKALPDQVKHVKDGGHQICSHTMHHLDLVTLDKQKELSEINDAFQALEGAGAPPTTAIRPPYGSLNMKTWLAGEGKFAYSFLWTKDSLDWKRPGADVIVKNCTGTNAPGDIILLHDGGGDRSQDVEALPQIIANLKAKGYRFVTMTELMQSDERIAPEVCNLDNTMPADAVWPTEIATY